MEGLYKPLPVSTVMKCNPCEVKAVGDGGFLRGFLQRYSSCEQLERDQTVERLQFKSIPLTARVKRTKAKQGKAKHRVALNSRQRKELQVFKIDPTEQRYELFLPLNQLWLDYIQDLINFDRIEQQQAETEQKLLRADYHGSEMKVTKSKCESLLGQQGIVVRETKNTWIIIRKDNTLKTIPKQNTVMSIRVRGYEFSIHGHNFCFRSSDRSARRFKGHMTLDM